MKSIIAGLILSLGLASYANAEVCSMENGSGGKIVLIVDKDLIGYTYSQNGAMMSLNWAYFEQTDQVFLKFSDGQTPHVEKRGLEVEILKACLNRESGTQPAKCDRRLKTYLQMLP